jgi:hypothetical protein
MRIRSQCDKKTAPRAQRRRKERLQRWVEEEFGRFLDEMRMELLSRYGIDVCTLVSLIEKSNLSSDERSRLISREARSCSVGEECPDGMVASVLPLPEHPTRVSLLSKLSSNLSWES